MYKCLLVGISLICISGCGKFSTPVDLQNAGVDWIKGIEISTISVSGITTDIKGIVISTPTFNLSGSVKVLEKQNSPLINIDRQEIVVFKKYDKNTQCIKVYKKYKENQLVSEEIEIINPIQKR